ncbi:hypothetical protein JAO76_06415 [Pontibacter sp. BT310]|uniref:Uncharacterized protein n=1 Tax=Pontibacter populi TaxID=890055 RepID=A0ABS6X9V1_9BACT|nr:MULTISPECIES: hypothetical protein [Pontibacter]MBJ6117815.1 hypothetical protein [Pontibacter sp. BT310]MBR0570241.1 hypothetical protein [Microvirga sp. STS03]MBW3364667.1 hypothetical protein [Pontibacter populi]
MEYKSKYIIDFFESRGWEQNNEGNLFLSLTPPHYLGLPQDYLLEVPKDDQKPGFAKYIDNILPLLNDIHNDHLNEDDLKTIFSTQDSIVNFRIIDTDTEDGSIQFQRFIDSLESIKKIFSQVVTYVASNKLIFGQAKQEVGAFLKSCRALQTQKGSFVTKFEIPNVELFTTINKINTGEINVKLFDTIDFIKHEIFISKNIPEITDSYLVDNLQNINVELFQSIRDFYKKSHINNAEFQLNSNYQYREILTERVQPRIKYLDHYIKSLKQYLLTRQPLEAVGYVRKLSSLSPLHSNRNEVFIEAEIANNKETIKVTLDSENYAQALEAHRNEWPIKVVGMAQQTKKMYFISDLESFVIYSSNE